MLVRKGVLTKIFNKDIADGVFCVPNDIIKIDSNFLSNKNLNLKIVKMSSKVKYDADAFYCCDNLEKVIIDKNEHDLAKYKDYIFSSDYIYLKGQLLLLDSNSFFSYLSKSKVKYPLKFLAELDEENVKNLCNKEITKHFKEIYMTFKDKLEKCNPIELVSFYKFAYSLGCFSDKKIKLNGNEIDMAQKACVFLKYIIDNDYITFGKYNKLFFDLNIKEPNYDFLKFITNSVKKKYEVESDDNYKKFKTIVDYPNLRYLLSKDSFSKIINGFGDIMELKFTNSNGFVLQKDEVSVRKRIEFYLKSSGFSNINEGNEDIASELSKHPLIEQKQFDYAQKIREESKGVASSILGYDLKETEIKEQIKKIKSDIESNCVAAKQKIDLLLEKEFTYEWLNKHDPRNFTVGLYCDCCAHILDLDYGKKIVVESVLNESVQNMVINDKKGNIVAKATVYINKSKGYAVFNNIEMRRQYGNEVYETDKTDNKSRKKIYAAFKRGVEDFVREYNAKHKIKITNVSVGWGHNRLKQIIRETEKISPAVFPVISCFMDAKEEQWNIKINSK